MGWMFDHSDAFSIQMEEEMEYREQQERDLKEALSLITGEMIENFVNFVVETKFIENKSVYQVAEMAGLPLRLEKDGREIALPWSKARIPTNYIDHLDSKIIQNGHNWWKRGISAAEFFEFRPDLRPQGEVFPECEKIHMHDLDRIEVVREGNRVTIKEFEQKIPSYALDYPFFGYCPEELIREVSFDVKEIVDEDDYREVRDRMYEAGFYKERLEDLIPIPSSEERRAAQEKKDMAAFEALKAEIARTGFAYFDFKRDGIRDLFKADPDFSVIGVKQGWMVYKKDADPVVVANAAGKKILNLVSRPEGRSLKISKSDKGLAVRCECVEDLGLRLEKPYGNLRVAELVITREEILKETNRVNTDRYTLDGLSQLWHFRSFETALENCITEAARKSGVYAPAEKALPELRTITGRSFTRNGNWINGEDWMKKQLSELASLARLAGIKCRNIDAVMNAYRR